MSNSESEEEDRKHIRVDTHEYLSSSWERICNFDDKMRVAETLSRETLALKDKRHEQVNEKGNNNRE